MWLQQEVHVYWNLPTRYQTSVQFAVGCKFYLGQTFTDQGKTKKKKFQACSLKYNFIQTVNYSIVFKELNIVHCDVNLRSDLT